MTEFIIKTEGPSHHDEEAIHSPDAYFESSVKTDHPSHEENEETLFKIFEKATGEWMERGTGDVKFLKHKQSGKIRLLMRRDKTNKICADHFITPDLRLAPNVSSDRSWVWSCPADHAEGEARRELMAIRLANSENALKFKHKFEECQKENANLEKAHEDTATPPPAVHQAHTSHPALVEEVTKSSPEPVAAEHHHIEDHQPPPKPEPVEGPADNHPHQVDEEVTHKEEHVAVAEVHAEEVKPAGENKPEHEEVPKSFQDHADKAEEGKESGEHPHQSAADEHTVPVTEQAHPAPEEEPVVTEPVQHAEHAKVSGHVQHTQHAEHAEHVEHTDHTRHTEHVEPVVHKEDKENADHVQHVHGEDAPHADQSQHVEQVKHTEHAEHAEHAEHHEHHEHTQHGEHGKHTEHTESTEHTEHDGHAQHDNHGDHTEHTEHA